MRTIDELRKSVVVSKDVYEKNTLIEMIKKLRKENKTQTDNNFVNEIIQEHQKICEETKYEETRVKHKIIIEFLELFLD